MPALSAAGLPQTADRRKARVRRVLPRQHRRALGSALRAAPDRARADGLTMLDPTRPPPTPIPAASVILVRERAHGDVEIFLVRRHRKSTFMSDSFVFPGGKIDPDDGGPEVGAIRELFEEAGVLFATGDLPDARRADWRRRLLARETTFAAML